MSRKPRAPRPHVSAVAFEAWVFEAEPGDQLIYHTGHLAQDRDRSPRVDQTARFALEHSFGEWPIVTKPPCGHIRGHLIGSGELTLTTRRRLDGRFDYVAVRR